MELFIGELFSVKPLGFNMTHKGFTNKNKWKKNKTASNLRKQSNSERTCGLAWEVKLIKCLPAL